MFFMKKRRHSFKANNDLSASSERTRQAQPQRNGDYLASSSSSHSTEVHTHLLSNASESQTQSQSQAQFQTQSQTNAIDSLSQKGLKDTKTTGNNFTNIVDKVDKSDFDSKNGRKVWLPPQKRDSNISKEESTTRQVNSMLNKLTIEKFEPIADKLAMLVENTSNTNELQHIANLVLDKAIIEPDWSEMYADLCQVLKWRAPNFEINGKSTSFSACLLSKIQLEYEGMPRELDAYHNEQDNNKSLKLKTRLLGIVKIIGELFRRKMFGFKVINSLVIDLVISSEEPFEHFIECFLQLIYTTGYYIEQSSYNPALDMWFGRLTELMNRKVYSKRIKCVMQDMLDLRKSNWKKNLHKETAKALSELRCQVEADDVIGGHHLAAQYGNIVTIGQRTNINSDCAYGNYMRRQEELANEKSREKLPCNKPNFERNESFTFPLIDFKYSFVDAAPADLQSEPASLDSPHNIQQCTKIGETICIETADTIQGDKLVHKKGKKYTLGNSNISKDNNNNKHEHKKNFKNKFNSKIPIEANKKVNAKQAESETNFTIFKERLNPFTAASTAATAVSKHEAESVEIENISTSNASNASVANTCSFDPESLSFEKKPMNHDKSEKIDRARCVPQHILGDKLKKKPGNTRHNLKIYAEITQSQKTKPLKNNTYDKPSKIFSDDKLDHTNSTPHHFNNTHQNSGHNASVKEVFGVQQKNCMIDNLKKHPNTITHGRRKSKSASLKGLNRDLDLPQIEKLAISK